MNAIKIADLLRKEADEVIYDLGLDAILQDYGEVFYAGSYALDLMAWRDVDISMVMAPEPFDIDAFFDMGRRIAHLDGVLRVRFANYLRMRAKWAPRGLYSGVRLEVGPERKGWKVDIWAVDQECLSRNKGEMQKVHSALTPEMRRLILEMKQALMLPSGRTPSLSGYHIYQAVLFEGLRTEEEIRPYLRDHGVEGV